LQQWAVDIILLDLKMLDMDAEDFLAKWRGQGAGDTPIVLLSAAAGLDEQADRLGVRGWVSKPFDIDELCATVRRFVVRDHVDSAALGIADGR
jgi:DNA-binding response OmpR family regulator